MAECHDLGTPELVVLDSSTPVECTRCFERFPSGNAFDWHLADIHEIDADDPKQFAVEVPENQPPLSEWVGGSA